MSTEKRRLLLVGAGSIAREIVSWMGLQGNDWNGFTFAGFLDDDPQALRGYPEYVPGVISSINEFRLEKGDGLIMGIAEPATKLAIARRLEKRGASFLTFVHPSALVARHVQIGHGVVICPNAVVSCHARLGDFVAVNLCCTVGHDTQIGAGCTLSAHADVTGFATLGEGVFLGSHASILPNAKVGAYAKIGAGTVVLRSVNAGATVMGVPAKQILP